MSSSPTEDHGTVGRKGNPGVPVQAELGLTEPDLEVGTEGAVAAAHRTGKVGDVFTFPHDVGMVGISHDTGHGRAGQTVIDTLDTAVLGLPVPVRPAIVATEPKRLGRIAVPVVPRLGAVVVVAKLGVPDADETTGVGEAGAQISQRKKEEFLIILEQEIRNRRNPGEVLVEGLGCRTTDAVVETELEQTPGSSSTNLIRGQDATLLNALCICHDNFSEPSCLSSLRMAVTGFTDGRLLRGKLPRTGVSNLRQRLFITFFSKIVNPR